MGIEATGDDCSAFACICSATRVFTSSVVWISDVSWANSHVEVLVRKKQNMRIHCKLHMHQLWHICTFASDSCEHDCSRRRWLHLFSVLVLLQRAKLDQRRVSKIYFHRNMYTKTPSKGDARKNWRLLSLHQPVARQFVLISSCIRNCFACVLRAKLLQFLE